MPSTAYNQKSHFLQVGSEAATTYSPNKNKNKTKKINK